MHDPTVSRDPFAQEQRTQIVKRLALDSVNAFVSVVALRKKYLRSPAVLSVFRVIPPLPRTPLRVNLFFTDTTRGLEIVPMSALRQFI